MINLDEYNFVSLEKNQNRIFEVWGHKKEMLFVDIRTCIGEIDVSIY